MEPFTGAQVWKPVFTEVQARVQDAGVSDWVSWQSQVSPITVLTTIGLLVSLGMWIFRVGGRNNEVERTQKSLETLQVEFKDLVRTRDASKEASRNERDAFQMAVNASMKMMEDRNSEFRAAVASAYATKKELTSLEERTSKDMDRIVGRLDQISGRLELIGDNVVTALGKMKG